MYTLGESKMDWRELIGLLATSLVFVSFMFTDIKKVRYVNIVGCILFVVYGLLIHALSVWILNGGCLLLHIYKIHQLNKSKT